MCLKIFLYLFQVITRTDTETLAVAKISVTHLGLPTKLIKMSKNHNRETLKGTYLLINSLKIRIH